MVLYKPTGPEIYFLFEMYIRQYQKIYISWIFVGFSPFCSCGYELQTGIVPNSFFRYCLYHLVKCPNFEMAKSNNRVNISNNIF